MSETKNPRYQGKPLLRLLELYILWAINELADKDALILEEMTPRLRQTFNCNGAWQEIIATVMEYPESMPDLIRSLWAKNLDIARRNSESLTPQRFAEMVADDNLPL